MSNELALISVVIRLAFCLSMCHLAAHVATKIDKAYSEISWSPKQEKTAGQNWLLGFLILACFFVVMLGRHQL